MNELSPKLQYFAAFVEAQPTLVQQAFEYALCLFLVENGKMCRVGTIPGDNGVIYFFEATQEVNLRFSVTKPLLSKETETALIKQLRTLLDDEDIF